MPWPDPRPGPFICQSPPHSMTLLELSGTEQILHNTIALKDGRMRSVLLWLIGVPIPIILLLALCTHHF